MPPSRSPHSSPSTKGDKGKGEAGKGDPHPLHPTPLPPATPPRLRPWLPPPHGLIVDHPKAGVVRTVTLCGDRQETQLCNSRNEFCFNNNRHCCAYGSDPAYCPGKEAGGNDQISDKTCKLYSAACRAGDQRSCLAAGLVCAALKAGA